MVAIAQVAVQNFTKGRKLDPGPRIYNSFTAIDIILGHCPWQLPVYHEAEHCSTRNGGNWQTPTLYVVFSSIKQVRNSHFIQTGWDSCQTEQWGCLCCVTMSEIRNKCSASAVMWPFINKLFKSPKIHYGVVLQLLTGTLIRANTETD